MSRNSAFMGAGDLDRRVRIEWPAKTQDPTYGTDIVTWTLLATVWGNVQDALPSRSESVAMGAALARSQTRLRIYWRDGIDSSMRVVIAGVVYQIVSMPAEIGGGRKRMLEMMLERFSS